MTLETAQIGIQFLCDYLTPTQIAALLKTLQANKAEEPHPDELAYNCMEGALFDALVDSAGTEAAQRLLDTAQPIQ